MIESKRLWLQFVRIIWVSRFLKQMRRNRDYERELMKDVEGWELGTLYGEPIYKTVPEDSIHLPTDGEFYAHASASDWKKRFMIQFHS